MDTARFLNSLTSMDGSKYVGDFAGDLPNGKGTLFYPNGTSVGGTWLDGNLVSTF